MSQRSIETVGVRYTAWAALDRDPQDDRVEFACPVCSAKGFKAARRARSEYRFADGFLQDPQGEMAVCRQCRRSLKVAPVVLVHDKDEQKRFQAIFLEELAELSKN